MMMLMLLRVREFPRYQAKLSGVALCSRKIFCCCLSVTERLIPLKREWFVGGGGSAGATGGGWMVSTGSLTVPVSR